MCVDYGSKYMAKKNKSTPSDNITNSCILDKKLAHRDAKQLGLRKNDLPNSIKDVINTLTQAGFEAYIVGGGVRDSLLGLKPKDFDAVTNATPIQIKEVFGKRCRIIGRRFQLCHVYSGRDMIEVATFRAPPKDDSFTTDEGMLTRDNVWGDIFQDVVRRDFSINALYYQPFENVVYDFCGGLKDISQKKIRLLGDTQKRIEEDPVRLLRALRFKAKLGFQFDSQLEKQFNPKNWQLLLQVSPHRLYDETQKMFTGGYLAPLLPLLFDYGALQTLLYFPLPLITPLVEQVSINTDKRIASNKSINPAFFYAIILWENYLYLLNKHKKNMSFSDAQNLSANKVLDKQRLRTAMPRFAEQFIKEIWLIQPRLAEPRKKNLLKLFEQPRFRAGYDFLMLREQVEAKNKMLHSIHGKPITLDDESTNGMGHWWAWFQTLDEKQQQKAIDEYDLAQARQRFANILTQNDSSNETLGKLSPQEQKEKDQLRLLSLANQSDEPPEPAKSLWDTVKPLATIQENLNNPIEREPAKTAKKTRNKKSAHIETPEATLPATDNPEQLAFPKLVEIIKERGDNPFDESMFNVQAKQDKYIPFKRKRRQPSSDLSILERQKQTT